MRNPDVLLSQTALLTAAAIYFALCFLVAWVFGRPRKVGLGWSFLFSVCFTPIFGFIITVYSSKLKR